MLSLIWIIFVVAVVLGFVIFVHELGHFIVAKLCGVKCEKFYLGFDIGGWKFFKFKYGETEYGIGVLPLGGYVKMLGQEDNPARLKEEIEKAKLHQQQPSPKIPEDQLLTKTPEALSDLDLASMENALYDPRSYLAKSVPKRMAIISAGVIMNVIFAFFAAMGAYYIGVKQARCGVGDLVPGDAAWRVGFRPGDQIIEIAGEKVQRFQDLQKYVAVGDIQNGVTMLIKRPGVKESLKFLLHPDQTHGLPKIGIWFPYSTTLMSDEPVWPGSAAARAKPSLKSGDRIVMIDGVKVENYQQLVACLTEHPDIPLQMTVECTVPAEGRKPDAMETSKLVNVTVPTQPMRTLGLVMSMGDIAAIQDGSPADGKIKVGDKIIKIDGKPIDDPMRLPQELRSRAGEAIIVTVQREGSPIDVPVVLRHADWFEEPKLEEPIRENNPVSIPELGIAYRVLNRVDRVIPGSPAQKAGIQSGEIIKQAVIFPAEKDQVKEKDNEQAKEKIVQEKITITFDDKNPDWRRFFYVLQRVDPRSPVKLTLNDGRTVELHMEDAAGWFNPDRGFILEFEALLVKAQSFTQAVGLGADETWEALTMVVRILRKLGTQVPVEELSGPIAIAKIAGQAAQQGPASLLLFLSFLSANLAVLNLLPIPILDGGHLIFLAYEGIRGKPADERVQIGLSLLGLAFLVGLMLYVTGNDIFKLFFKWH
ncbi:MAG: site-2 protease family protein [Thermoguttaceae bacterium]